MKNFLKYVGVFSASLILLIIGVEYMLRQVPNALAFKKELIEKHTQDTKNLIIGSSVVNCGINPAYLADSTYNLAISGEWFRFNQILLEKYIQQKLPINGKMYIVWNILETLGSMTKISTMAIIFHPILEP
ncbi:hypothetical protein [Phocaeicola plebeius]|uniref:hypothetical protein n=1 Tax=Phocaeicola plebeius TaxID=310297 RepID=UPI003AF0B74E